MGRVSSTNGRKEECIYDIVRRARRRRPLGRPGRRWVDNIKIYLGKIGSGVTVWIYLAQHTNQWRSLVKTAMDLRVP
jgi:hypothetical protein